MSPPSIYVYKITADDGIAPCPQDGILSLGVCKPAIRRAARERDYLVGVGSNDWYPGKLIYVAQVGSLISGSEYFKKGGRYWNRYDCIYRHLGNDKYEWRNHGGRYVHDPRRMPDQKNRDVGWCGSRTNAVVLLAHRFVYFGQDTAGHSAGIWRQFPAVWKKAEALRQSHLVNHTPTFQQHLMDFCECILQQNWPNAPEVDAPHHRPSAVTCHDNRRAIRDCSRDC